MRSLSDLQKQASQAGIVIQGKSREQLMDALRDKLGTPDPDLQIDPMKAKDLKNDIAWGTEDPFAGISKYLTSAYVVEPKLDGARVRLFLGETQNSLNTGRRSDLTYAYIERADNFPHLRDAVVSELNGTIIDAELMMPPGTSIETKPGDFTKGPLNTIMAVLNINADAAVARQAKYGNATMWAFDVLAVKGESVMHKPLAERRKMLELVVERLQLLTPNVVAIPQFEATATNIQAFLDAGYEGGMIKRTAATYQPNKRSADWLKVKRMSTGDFFIIGSTPGKGKNEGKVGSLKLAYYDESKLDKSLPVKEGFEAAVVYCADMRGFDDATMDMLTDPETGDVKDEFIGRVVEVMAQGRTKNERLRHPHFVRWREDKRYFDCDRTQLELFTEV
jgi:ATP-dependent DNA ligase